ncbi:hypothetical protein AGLY_014725 [Aphis glycines]|uniref:Uncharacterized protein n=1 Tax=Aphis glycines TaxID=307491 RepID=A0A6G0T2V5_APHGL|nr:hypothetical protein AGLY_014725 [Aphis glycines]
MDIATLGVTFRLFYGVHNYCAHKLPEFYIKKIEELKFERLVYTNDRCEGHLAYNITLIFVIVFNLLLSSMCSIYSDQLDDELHSATVEIDLPRLFRLKHIYSAVQCTMCIYMAMTYHKYFILFEFKKIMVDFYGRTLQIKKIAEHNTDMDDEKGDLSFNYLNTPKLNHILKMPIYITRTCFKFLQLFANIHDFDEFLSIFKLQTLIHEELCIKFLNKSLSLCNSKTYEKINVEFFNLKYKYKNFMNFQLKILLAYFRDFVKQFIRNLFFWTPKIVFNLVYEFGWGDSKKIRLLHVERRGFRTWLSNHPRPTSECAFRIDDESIIILSTYI